MSDLGHRRLGSNGPEVLDEASEAGCPLDFQTDATPGQPLRRAARRGALPDDVFAQAQRRLDDAGITPALISGAAAR